MGSLLAYQKCGDLWQLLRTWVVCTLRALNAACQEFAELVTWVYVHYLFCPQASLLHALFTMI